MKENLKLVLSAIMGIACGVWLNMGWAGIFPAVFVYMMMSDTRTYFR